MKNWRKIFSGVVVLVVAVIVAGVAIIKSIDLNEYKGLIVEEAKKATGRDLTIAGDLNLELSFSPAVAVEGVTFANAPWGSRKEMVKLKRFAAEVELLPLLTGNVQVKRLVLVGLDLLIETNKKGRGNWELKGQKEKAAKKKPSEGPSGTLPVVRLVGIEDLTLTYRDGRSGDKTVLRLDKLNVRSDGTNKPMDIDMTGAFNGKPFKVSGVLGSLETFIKGRYQLDGLKANIAGSDLGGRVSVRLAGVARPKVDAELNSSLLDLDALLPPSKQPKDSGKSDRDRVFPADPLPADVLKSADARVRLKAARLLSGGVAVKDVEVLLVLGGGRLDIKPLRATVGGGKINANVVFDGSGPTPALTINLDARQVDYGAVLKQLKMTDIATGKIDGKINVKGRGGSVRAVMAGLNGRVRLVTKGGQVESGLLNVLSADVMSALPFVDSKGDKSIRCGVVDFDIRNGRAKARTLIFETGGLSMIGAGGINLANETIDIKINPRAKKVSILKLAMVPVNVGGTLANPSAAPDLAGTVVGAVSTVKDIATGGASVIGKLVGIGGDESSGQASSEVDKTDYCKLALAGKSIQRATAKSQPAPATAPPPSETDKGTTGSTMENVDKKLDQLGKDLGGALKGLFGK
jgi:uncharacterized protein involved in outer membrane biogenesis